MIVGYNIYNLNGEDKNLDKFGTPVYWGENLEHEMCPCKRKCGTTSSFMCTDGENCPAFRRWHFNEMEAIKKDLYRATGRKM